MIKHRAYIPQTSTLPGVCSLDIDAKTIKQPVIASASVAIPLKKYAVHILRTLFQGIAAVASLPRNDSENEECRRKVKKNNSAFKRRYIGIKALLLPLML